MRQIAIAFLLLSASLAMWVFGSEADEVSVLEFTVFTVSMLAILGVQLLLLFIVNGLLRAVPPAVRNWILLAVAAALVAANAYYLAFITLADVPGQTRIAYSALVGIVFLIVMSFPRLRPALAIFAGAILVVSLFQYGYIRATLGSQDVTAETASLPIKSTRNVYIIGNESLHSPKAYRELYGVENPAFIQVLKDLGFRVLENSYSAERATLRTYSRIFEFKRNFDNDDLGNRTVFINDNSTFRSFRESGYNIQIVYVNNFFAVNPANVNYTFPRPGFDACDDLNPHFFYGLCQRRVVRKINRDVLGIPKIKYPEEIAQLQKRVAITAKSSQPWLTFSHIKFPFHTDDRFPYTDQEYATFFKNRVYTALPIVADNVKNTAGFIIAHDPNAVVIVMGDHGSHLYRGLTPEIVYSDNPPLPFTAILEADHGVMMAVYPPDFCTNRIAAPFSTKFLIENIVACLNGDDAPSEKDQARLHEIRFYEQLHDVRELLKR